MRGTIGQTVTRGTGQELDSCWSMGKRTVRVREWPMNDLGDAARDDRAGVADTVISARAEVDRRAEGRLAAVREVASARRPRASSPPASPGPPTRHEAAVATRRAEGETTAACPSVSTRVASRC
jgi:hypothetical protein